MKEKWSKCSIDIFLTMILLSWITYIFLHWFIYIYIYKIFSKNIQIISLADYKEKIEIYTKYLQKKSNWVGCKYLRLHRWISQVGSVHFARKCWFRKVEVILQLRDNFVTRFAAWRWCHNKISSCENIIWTCKVAHVCM